VNDFLTEVYFVQMGFREYSNMQTEKRARGSAGKARENRFYGGERDNGRSRISTSQGWDSTTCSCKLKEGNPFKPIGFPISKFF